MENAYQQKQRMTLLLRMRDVRKRSRGEWLVFPVLDSATPCRHLSRAFLKKSEVTGAEFFPVNFIRIRWASSKRFWTTSHLADSGSALKWQRNDNNNFCHYHYSNNNREFRQRRLWAMHVNRKAYITVLFVINIRLWPRLNVWASGRLYYSNDTMHYKFGNITIHVY